MYICDVPLVIVCRQYTLSISSHGRRSVILGVHTHLTQHCSGFYLGMGGGGGGGGEGFTVSQHLAQKKKDQNYYKLPVCVNG